MITTLLLSLALSAQDAATAQPEPAAEARTAVPAPAMSDAERREALAGVNAALNAIDTLQARFVQTNPDGSPATGTLSVRRPGRLRFEYDTPTPVLIVADGTTVAIQDTELETVDRVPIRSTPLWWILKSDVDLTEDAIVRDVWREDGFLYVGLEDADEDVEGSALFLFDAETYALSQWFATDAAGMTTRLVLEDVETDLSLNPRLFILEDADARDSRRDRR
jgi:outer membrane lipoprotein-sorting protein